MAVLQNATNPSGVSYHSCKPLRHIDKPSPVVVGESRLVGRSHLSMYDQLLRSGTGISVTDRLSKEVQWL